MAPSGFFPRMFPFFFNTPRSSVASRCIAQAYLEPLFGASREVAARHAPDVRGVRFGSLGEGGITPNPSAVIAVNAGCPKRRRGKRRETSLSSSFFVPSFL